MKILFPLLLVLAAGIAIADEKPKLDDLDPFSDEYDEALEKHTGPPFAAELPAAALSEAFKEPMLAEAAFKDRELYRFTLFPTFDKPMTFRLEVIDDSEGVIHLKRLSGKGGYDLGTAELSSSISLKGHAFEDLLKRMLTESGSTVYRQLDPEPFVSACVALAKAAGFQLGRHSDALEPIKREDGADQPATALESKAE
ncbi:MAG: hypothetical protein O3A92_05015 [Verrucomicrobia bacterium]|nr:hypothetical protein [Verrucomicrobiota bacterium]